MKKFVLPVLLLLAVGVFLPSEANAQTREECDKTRARASYNCLTAWSKCYYPCIDQTKDVKACWDSCTQAENACNKQVDAEYKTCLTPQKGSSPLKKDKTPLEKLLDTPVFVGEWFDRISAAWAGLGFLDVSRALGEVVLTDPEIAIWEEEQRQKYAKDVELFLQENIDRPVGITLTDEQKAWNSSLVDVAPDKEKIIVVEGEGRLKTVDSDQFIRITAKETPIFVTFLDSVVSEPVSEPLMLIDTWGVDAGSVINVSSDTEIQFLEPVQDKETQDVTRTVRFKQGEVEVKTRNTDPNNKFEVQASSVNVVAPRTHFWVSRDSDKNQVVVGIYEGEVQITARDGRTTSLVPNGDRPGVAVITRKLSLFKLAVVILVLIGILSGVVWLGGRKLRSSKKR